ncbi:MAG: FG-GAP-like repeat-containing protein [Phycisphaerales bacterium]
MRDRHRIVGMGVGGAMALGLAAASEAMGGTPCDPEWVCFEEQSDARIAAPDDLVLADQAQKAYAWGDVNNDGLVDLVIVRKQPWTNAGKRTNVLLINEGGVLVDRTAEYAAATDHATDLGFLTPTNERDVVIADVNNDGWPDIVTATYSLAPEIDEPKHVSHPRVYINLGADGNGDWLGFRYEVDRFPQMHPFADPRFYSVTAADVNADGFADLYFTDGDFGFPASAVDFDDRVFLNDGTGHFFDATGTLLPPAFTGPGEGTRGGAADFNADGTLDLYKVNAVFSPIAVQILYAEPDPGPLFDPLVQMLSQGTVPTSVLASDLNNDGFPDLVLTDDGADRYLLNQGVDAQTGRASFIPLIFEHSSGSDQGFGGRGVAGDLDNDGWTDVLIADVDFEIPGCQRRAAIYRNLGDAPLVTLREEVVGAQTTGRVACISAELLRGTYTIALLDIDGDGWLDIVAGQCTGTHVFMNTGGARAACPGDLDANGVVNSDDLGILLSAFANNVCGDIDGDGATDSDDLGLMLSAIGTACP